MRSTIFLALLTVPKSQFSQSGLQLVTNGSLVYFFVLFPDNTVPALQSHSYVFHLHGLINILKLLVSFASLSLGSHFNLFWAELLCIESSISFSFRLVLKGFAFQERNCADCNLTYGY